MAKNLKVQIGKGKPYGDPEAPTIPWNVNMEWYVDKDVEVPLYDGEGVGEENITGYRMETVQEAVRTWSVEAPSELVARTIELAFSGMTDGMYLILMGNDYET